MSLLNSIEKLRRSSHATKRFALFISVSAAMLIILGLWALQLKYYSGARDNGGAVSIQKPFKILWEMAIENFKGDE